METISLSKYRIERDLREQEVYYELIKDYEHKDTLEEMKIQEVNLFMKYI